VAIIAVSTLECRYLFTAPLGKILFLHKAGELPGMVKNDGNIPWSSM
jgi:hypothetical protein